MFEFEYCPQCGTKMVMRYLKGEGEIPYCEKCKDFRFPVFSTAVSMIVMNESKDKVLLIKQYNRDSYILTAGYVNKGEDSETTCARELMEELHLHAKKIHYNKSHYFAPHNVLMLNYTVIVDEDEYPVPNDEVDSWDWMSVDDARKKIYPGSLAQKFLEGYITGKYEF